MQAASADEALDGRFRKIVLDEFGTAWEKNADSQVVKLEFHQPEFLSAPVRKAD